MQASQSKHLPRGATEYNLSVSIQVASTYGRFGLSSKFGSRSEPTTASISACARSCTSGCCSMASMKHCNVDADYKKLSSHTSTHIQTDSFCTGYWIKVGRWTVILHHTTYLQKLLHTHLSAIEVAKDHHLVCPSKDQAPSLMHCYPWPAFSKLRLGT